MNNAHLHVISSHLRIIFRIVGLIICFIKIFAKSAVCKPNASHTFILGARATMLARAGVDGAEEAVEGLHGVTELVIEAHQEASAFVASLSYFLGGTALTSLIERCKNLGFHRQKF